jgi:hypothetical protein
MLKLLPKKLAEFLDREASLTDKRAKGAPGKLAMVGNTQPSIGRVWIPALPNALSEALTLAGRKCCSHASFRAQPEAIGVWARARRRRSPRRRDQS